MNCQELYFNLLAIYVVPKSETDKWVDYPWNVPYSPEVATLTLAQMGFADKDGKSGFTRWMETLNTFHRFTSYDGSTGNMDLVTYCDEQMTASAKPKTQTAGTMWENTLKCTAIHPTRDDQTLMARLMKEPHDLVLVSAEQDFFLLRTPVEGYQMESAPSLGTGWRHEVQFSLKNCHGMQHIVID